MPTVGSKPGFHKSSGATTPSLKQVQAAVKSAKQARSLSSQVKRSNEKRKAAADGKAFVARLKEFFQPKKFENYQLEPVDGYPEEVQVPKQAEGRAKEVGSAVVAYAETNAKVHRDQAKSGSDVLDMVSSTNPKDGAADSAPLLQTTLRVRLGEIELARAVLRPTTTTMADDVSGGDIGAEPVPGLQSVPERNATSQEYAVFEEAKRLPKFKTASAPIGRNNKLEAQFIASQRKLGAAISKKLAQGEAVLAQVADGSAPPQEKNRRQLRRSMTYQTPPTEYGRRNETLRREKSTGLIQTDFHRTRAMLPVELQKVVPLLQSTKFAKYLAEGRTGNKKFDGYVRTYEDKWRLEALPGQTPKSKKDLVSYMDGALAVKDSQNMDTRSQLFATFPPGVRGALIRGRFSDRNLHEFDAAYSYGSKERLADYPTVVSAIDQYNRTASYNAYREGVLHAQTAIADGKYW